jgi:hypothetical protein
MFVIYLLLTNKLFYIAFKFISLQKIKQLLL